MLWRIEKSAFKISQIEVYCITVKQNKKEDDL